MRIQNLDMMTEEKLREAADAIAQSWDNALAEYNVAVAKAHRRMNSAQRERIAYLKGVLAGASSAAREIEKRAPLIIVGSGAK